MQIHTRKRIIEAEPDGLGGPRWLAVLEDGRQSVGRPSWLRNSGNVPLPDRADMPATDWGRLMLLAQEEAIRIKTMSLWFPQWGEFLATPDAGAYGYFEEHVSNLKIRFEGYEPYVSRPLRKGVSAICLCWPEEGYGIKVLRITADGTLEHRRRLEWLPCMIGQQDITLDLQ